MSAWLSLASGLIGVLVGAFTSLYAQHRSQQFSSRQAREDRAREMVRGGLLQLLELHVDCVNYAFALYNTQQAQRPQATHAFNVGLLRFAAALACIEDGQLKTLCNEYLEVLHALSRSGDERDVQGAALRMQERVAQLLVGLN
jgi:hypothetical protein